MKKITAKILFSAIALMICASISPSQTVSADKTRLVNQVTEQTFEAFPVEFFEIEIEKVKKESGEQIKSEFTNLIIKKTEENPDLSSQKKEEIKAKVPDFSERFGNKVAEVIGRDLDINLWIKEALADNFAKNFTVAELKKIDSFMKGTHGKAFFAAVKEIASAKIQKQEAGTPQLTARQSIEIEKFINSPLGKKFMDVFGDNTENFLTQKIDVWGDNMLKNIEESMEKGELGEMLEQFIAENFQ